MLLNQFLLLASALFCIGVYGVLTRRQAIAVLLSVELMANASNMVFIAFSRFRGGATGPIFAIFSLAITVAEVAVGLGLVILLYRRFAETRLDHAREMSQ